MATHGLCIKLASTAVSSAGFSGWVTGVSPAISGWASMLWSPIVTTVSMPTAPLWCSDWQNEPTSFEVVSCPSGLKDDYSTVVFFVWVYFVKRLFVSSLFFLVLRLLNFSIFALTKQKCCQLVDANFLRVRCSQFWWNEVYIRTCISEGQGGIWGDGKRVEGRWWFPFFLFSVVAPLTLMRSG